MVVGVCRLELHFLECHSLKAKRKLLRPVIDRTKHKFNVAIAEIGQHDLLCASSVGFCVIGNEEAHVQSMLDHIVGFIEDMHMGDLIDIQKECIHYSEKEPLYRGSDDDFASIFGIKD